MGKCITELKVQQKNKNRIAVFIDGEFVFGIAAILATHLHVGQEITEDQISTLVQQDELETAYLRADHFIAFRPRTRLEVTRKLQTLGYSNGIIENTLARLEESGLVNDKQFTSLWVDARTASKPRGRRLLDIELRQKGIDPETIQEALQVVDEKNLVLIAGSEYTRRLHGCDERKFKQRLSQFLLRRGFAYANIPPVVNKLWVDLDKKIILNEEKPYG